MTKLQKFIDEFLKGKELELAYDFVIGKKNPLTSCEWRCISALLMQSDWKKDDTVQICDDFLCAQAVISPASLKQCKKTLQERGFFKYSVEAIGDGTVCSTYALNKNKINEFRNS